MTENYRVYIPSRGRPQNVEKLLSKWCDQYFDVFFMVEPDEKKLYEDAIPGGYEFFKGIKVEVLGLPVKNGGVGNSRALCVEHASEAGHESIILSDDDIIPRYGMDDLADECEDHRVFAITARQSYSDFTFRLKAAERNDLVMVVPSITKMFAINVPNCLAVGNFARDVPCVDDAEMKFRCHEAGYPWLLHLGTKTGSIGNRFAPGGVTALEQTEDADVKSGVGEVHERAIANILRRHGQYIPKLMERHKTKVAVNYKWTKIHDHFMPGWRDWSWRHGGSLENYFNGR